MNRAFNVGLIRLIQLEWKTSIFQQTIRVRESSLFNLTTKIAICFLACQF